jgi:ribosomal protein L7/L12
MRSANKIWKMRNRIKKGDASLMIQIDEEIEDYLAQGQKIQAIKYYRNEISKLTGTEPLLKESKKYVDSIQIYMERRNMI